MMIGAIGDSHFDEHSRFDECISMHDAFTDACVERRVSCVVHAGDVYERASTPSERRAVVDWVQRTSAAIQGPMVIVRGNHDTLRDLEILRRLDTEYPVIVEEGAGIHMVVSRGEVVQIAALAWPRKAQVLAAIDRPVSPEESSSVAQEALRDVLRAFGSRPGPKVLVAHAMLTGAVTSTGQPLVGQDMEVDLTDLSLARADITLLGHIHKSQEWDFPIDGRTNPIIYTGSPRRTAYGEIEEKSWTLVNIGKEGLRGWSRVPLPCQQMVLIENEWRDGAWVHKEDADCTDVGMGWDVRFRYRVRAEELPAAKRSAESVAEILRSKMGCTVKTEPVVVAAATARAPEVAQARRLSEKLVAMWDRRGDVPDVAARARLLEKVAELE